MPKEPTHVRLRPEANQAGDTAVAPVGILADTADTGWHISGLEVKPFPAPDDEEYSFVRTALRSGRLEESTQAEYDAHCKATERLAQLHPVKVPEGETPSPWNEPLLLNAAKKERKKLMEIRRGNTVEDDSEEGDEEYEDMTANDLRSLLQSRGLATSGNKQELADRLREDDEAQANA